MDKVMYNSGSKSKNSEGNHMLAANYNKGLKNSKQYISFKDSKELAKSSPVNRNISASPIGELV